jgi:hypothetical protein
MMKQARQRQEDPLNLRSLPLVTPPDDQWPAIESALIARGRRRIWQYAAGALAAAATVALTLAMVIDTPFGEVTGQSPQLSQDPAPGQMTAPAAAVQDTAVEADPLGSLITLSQQLETRLRAYRSGVGDMPAGALMYQVELEDLVVQVDEQLSMYPDSLELWSQRVNLLLDLSKLYENRLRRDYHRMASL